MYTLPELSQELAKIAEKELVRFSGQNKCLEILIKFNYGQFSKDDKGDKHWLAGEDDNQHIKILFWRPNNAMCVLYNYERYIEDITNEYLCSANHSSTWKYDGLDFFHKILHKPTSWEIIESKVIENISITPGIEESTYVIAA
jgi:hypothetical protein